LVLPITHAMPDDPGIAVELPIRVKTRLRLDGERSWVIVSESNRFIWPGPDLRNPGSGFSDGYYSALPDALFDEIRERYIILASSRRHATVPRTT
jgi:hypothetical protein